MESFSREKRLLTKEAYSNVFKRNQRSYDHVFTVLASKTSRDVARLGLAISKKNLKRAHDRNQVKRIVRESFRRHQQQLKGLDIVVMVQSKVDADNKALLHESLEKHWIRVIELCARY